MIKHPIRKFAGLTVLYIVLILGIFLLQFRSETVISESFGNMRLQLTETQTQNTDRQLKNRFQISFRGLVLSGDDTHPVYLTTTTAEEPLPVALTGWRKNGDLSFTLYFENNVSLLFSVSDTTQEALLSIIASLPENAENLSILYKPSGGYLVTEKTESQTIISSKSSQYQAHAAAISDDRFTILPQEPVISYGIYDPTEIFDFTSVHGIAAATETAYTSAIQQFTGNFIRLFSSSISDSLPEQTVTSYIAAMAANGDYSTAIGQIPDSIRRSARRTYLSAPFFDSLVSMNNSLVMQLENRESMISYAISQHSFDVFKIHNLAETLCILDSRQDAINLVSMPNQLNNFEPSAAQAAGILNTYTRLSGLDSELAAHLIPVLEPCLGAIAKACTVVNDQLHLQEDNVSVSVPDSVLTGTALIKYGRLTGNNSYAETGYLLITTLLNTTEMNLRLMGEIYPILIPDNKFYPHIEIFANATETGENTIWAWTAALSTGYSRDAAGNITLSVDFPQGAAHYIIINGIESFRRIDLYNIAFRTDPRFESYNSSGYVYNSTLKTLFLKSLHRTRTEQIKLYYDRVQTAGSAPETTDTNSTVANILPADENTTGSTTLGIETGTAAASVQTGTSET